jgi:hypothetical protein
MVWGAVIGAAAGLIGSKMSGDAAKDAGKAQAAADKERLDFEKEQYQEWQDTYGGIEDNLAAYYDQLTPTLRATQGLEAFEKEKDIALTGLRENLAQRGISTSGIAAQTETSVAVSSAAERARIRAAAPMETAKEKLGFLTVGLGQDAAGGVSGALQTQSANAASDARAAAGLAGKATGAAVKAGANLASELADVFTRKQEPAPVVEGVPV